METLYSIIYYKRCHTIIGYNELLFCNRINNAKCRTVSQSVLSLVIALRGRVNELQAYADCFCDSYVLSLE